MDQIGKHFAERACEGMLDLYVQCIKVQSYGPEKNQVLD